MRLFQIIKDGLIQFKNHPQLWLTVFVAIAIFSSYLFIANRFILIAKQAQDELVNVRIGSLQDAFAPLASVLFNESDLLRKHMVRLARLNPTIVDFSIVQKSANGKWKIIYSVDRNKEGTDLVGYELVLNLAEANPDNSFTVEEIIGGDRFFQTSRAIVDEKGSVKAIAVTKQSMSWADKKISADIKNGMLILILIMLFLLLLFFKHARIIDYAVLYKQLKEIDKMKDDFVSMASHELRTPLTAIRGYVDILKSLNEVKSETGVKSLDRIDISAKELDSLIADILDVSRIQQGRLSYEIQVIDPYETLQHVVDTLSASAQDKGLKFTVEAERNLKINADPNRLRQVLINVIGNAIKYTSEGSVTVQLKKEQGKVVFVVADTGLGMSPEDLSHLFKKFWRSPDKNVRKQKGTGLGMWITKQIVEYMNGVIYAQSIKGSGTTFTIEFPHV